MPRTPRARLAVHRTPQPTILSQPHSVSTNHTLQPINSSTNSTLGKSRTFATGDRLHQIPMISARSTAEKANMGSFSSSLSLRVRNKLSGIRTSKKQTHTETANPHPNNKSTPNPQTDTETSNLHPNNKPTPNQRVSSALLDQTTTMEQLTLTHHPSELLNQVAMAMGGRHPELSVTVPRLTTWKAALRAIDSALGEVDGPMMVTYKRSESIRQKLRQVALQNVKDWSSASTSPGLPIRTQYDTNSLPMPKPASEEKRKQLKE